MPWTCGKNTCPSRYTFFGKGCKRTLFRGLERATWTGYSNSKNRPLTLFEKEYYDPPPAYRRRPEITRMEAQTASARGYLKLPGRHPFPAAGGQRKGTSLRMSLSFEMCGQKRCTLSKALQRNRISILEAFQSNNFCNGFYCLTPKDEFHHLQTNYFSWQLLSLLRSHMYKQL